MTPKSRKGLPLLTMFSTFCSFDAGFPHLCAVKARKKAVAPAFFLVQQPLLLGKDSSSDERCPCAGSCRHFCPRSPEGSKCSFWNTKNLRNDASLQLILT